MGTHILAAVLRAFLLASPETAPADSQGPLVVSTMPFVAPEEQAAIFQLLSRHLNAVLGRPVTFRAGRSYAGVIEALEQGSVDVAFVGAAAYVMARRKGGVRVILRTIRDRRSSYRGVVVVRRGSSVKSLSDLKGKRFAFVDKRSTTGYFFAHPLLERAGIDPEKDLKVVFAGGHHKVVAMVARGEVDAGACFEGAEDSLEDPQAVFPVARTEPVPGDPVVVRAGLGPETIKRLRSALIELSTLSEARPFFEYSDIDSFMPAHDCDYDHVAEVVRRLQ